MHFNNSFMLLGLTSLVSSMAINANNGQPEPTASANLSNTTTPSNTTGHFPHPLILKEIIGGICGLHTAATSIKHDGPLNDGPLNDDLAYRIKQQSNDDSCQPILGKHGSVSWEFYVRTSGKRCDTTAELKTIRDFVGFATDAMTWYSYDAACVRMRHGKGTWVGHLQLQDHDRRLDSRGDICTSFNYPIGLPRDGL